MYILFTTTYYLLFYTFTFKGRVYRPTVHIEQFFSYKHERPQVLVWFMNLTCQFTYLFLYFELVNPHHLKMYKYLHLTSAGMWLTVIVISEDRYKQEFANSPPD